MALVLAVDDSERLQETLQTCPLAGAVVCRARGRARGKKDAVAEAGGT